MDCREDYGSSRVRFLFSRNNNLFIIRKFRCSLPSPSRRHESGLPENFSEPSIVLMHFSQKRANEVSGALSKKNSSTTVQSIIESCESFCSFSPLPHPLSRVLCTFRNKNPTGSQGSAADERSSDTKLNIVDFVCMEASGCSPPEHTHTRIHGRLCLSSPPPPHVFTCAYSGRVPLRHDAIDAISAGIQNTELCSHSFNLNESLIPRFSEIPKSNSSLSRLLFTSYCCITRVCTAKFFRKRSSVDIQKTLRFSKVCGQMS